LQASLAPAKLCELFSGTGGKLVSKAWSSKPSEVAPAGAFRGASTSLDVVRLPTDGVGEGGTPDAALDGKPAGQVTELREEPSAYGLACNHPVTSRRSSRSHTQPAKQ